MHLSRTTLLHQNWLLVADPLIAEPGSQPGRNKVTRRGGCVIKVTRRGGCVTRPAESTLTVFVIILVFFSGVAFGQMYGDPSLVRPDTAKQDTVQAIILEEAVPEVAPGPPAADLAKRWTRRLLLRGVLNTNHIGAFAEYQLTDWSLATGSGGPIRAYLKVVYLGPIIFLGEDAEWVQVSVRVLGEVDKRVAFDFLLPTSAEQFLPLRTLVREEGQALREISFALPAGRADYDALDNPRDVGEETVELSHGKYYCGHFRGSGEDGAPVDLFLSPEVSPYGIVVMGYGDEGLTLIRKGADATPLFDVPPPPSR